MNHQFDHQILSRHRFALVDPSACDFLPADVIPVPVVPVEIPASAHLMPALLELRNLSPQANSALLEMLHHAHQRADAPVVALLIDTELSTNDFVKYWNRIQIASPSSQRRFWLRLHDPRVLHQLRRVLSAAQWRKLLGPLYGVSYWAGNEWLHAGRQSNGHSAAGDLGVAPWPWDRVRLIGTINRALEGAGIASAKLLHQGAESVEQLVATARKFNLTDQPDLVEFAVRGLCSSPTFYEHPDVAPALRPSGDPDDDSRLSDRLALIGEHVWVEISSAL